MAHGLPREVALETCLDRAFRSVEVDPSQLEQILVNLLVNARDAMPTGGRITIVTDNVEIDEGFARQHPAVAPGRYVRLAVTDTGCGIPAAVQDETLSRVAP